MYIRGGHIFSLEADCLTEILKQVYNECSILTAMNDAICNNINFDFKRHVLDVISIYAKRFRSYGNGAYR